MFWQLLLQVILIFLNAVFACAEIAVISINDAKLDNWLQAATNELSVLKISLTSRQDFLRQYRLLLRFPDLSVQRLQRIISRSLWQGLQLI